MADVTKQEVLRLIERMPDDASLEDILYELYVRSEIEEGLKDIQEDRIVPHEEVVRSISKWLQSAGHERP